MLTKHLEQRASATSELAEHCSHLDSSLVVDSLTAGLTHLRKMLMTRIHEDVERDFGIDSMIAPVSRTEEEKQAQRAKIEIEAYSIVVVNDEVAQGGYVNNLDEWFLDWLFELRLGDEQRQLFERRVKFYRSPSAEERRRKFLSVLQRAVPESSRTPLVLFRLFPRAVRIVAAVAFGDRARANQLRVEQRSFLPAVGDCFECQGRVLDNDDVCRVCGNPVWEFTWLQSD